MTVILNGHVWLLSKLPRRPGQLQPSTTRSRSLPFAQPQFQQREPVLAASSSLALLRAAILARRSDADRVIVVRQSPVAPHEGVFEFLRAFLDAPVPVDCLVLTEAEAHMLQAEGRPFWRRLQREGVLLAARASPEGELAPN